MDISLPHGGLWLASFLGPVLVLGGKNKVGYDWVDPLLDLFEALRRDTILLHRMFASTP